jgi:hypothetical protein
VLVQTYICKMPNMYIYTHTYTYLFAYIQQLTHISIYIYIYINRHVHDKHASSLHYARTFASGSVLPTSLPASLLTAHMRCIDVARVLGPMIGAKISNNMHDTHGRNKHSPASKQNINNASGETSVGKSSRQGKRGGKDRGRRQRKRQQSTEDAHHTAEEVDGSDDAHSGGNDDDQRDFGGNLGRDNSALLKTPGSNFGANRRIGDPPEFRDRGGGYHGSKGDIPLYMPAQDAYMQASTQGGLRTVDIPREMQNGTCEQLFAGLLQQRGQILVGLLRRDPASNLPPNPGVFRAKKTALRDSSRGIGATRDDAPQGDGVGDGDCRYVVTNPSKTTILRQGDRAIVLAPNLNVPHKSGFFTPEDDVSKRRSEELARSSFGVGIVWHVHGERGDVLSVAGFARGSEAGDAGICVGDVLVYVDGRPVGGRAFGGDGQTARSVLIGEPMSVVRLGFMRPLRSQSTRSNPLKNTRSGSESAGAADMDGQTPTGSDSNRRFVYVAFAVRRNVPMGDAERQTFELL